MPLTTTMIFATSAPPSAVWAALEAAPRWPEVLDDVAQARIEPKGELTVGSVIRSYAKPGAETADTVFRVAAARKPRELTIEAQAGAYRWRDSYTIERDRENGGTKVTLTAVVEATRALDRILLFLARKRYIGAFRTGLVPAAERFKPQLVMISAGFDSRVGDPLGRFTLTDGDFAELTDVVTGIARQHARGRLVSVLEGGYSLDGVARAVTAHLARQSA